MAKFGVYYGLCPLIDQKSLLGVAEDETEGFVIVTLGKNMAIKYKLSDQKQIHSWSTKDHLTSHIVYDKTFNQYVAVFNYTFIRIFGSDCERLDRIKKYKFQKQLHSLISTKNGKTLVLFKNGTVMELKYAIDNRKTNLDDPILDNNDVIESYDVCFFEDRIAINLLVKDEKNDFKFLILFLTEDKEFQDISNTITIKFNKVSMSLTGHMLIHRDDTVNLVTLWSDGKLHVMSLDNNEKFPGPLLSTVESLSCKQQVCMLGLSSTYIALYGTDRHEEGASLVIYNIQFKVTQCKQAFKLYTVGSKLYLIRNNMLLTVGNHLAVLPYQLATEQLAALVGSHKRNNSVSILTEIVDWGEVESIKNDDCIKNIPHSIKQYVENFHNEGYPERLISSEIITKFIENQNIHSLFDALSYFTEIPESLIVDLILFVLTANNNLFESDKIDIDNCPIKSLKRCQLLNNILDLSYNDVLIIPYLRCKLQISHILKLLEYICTLLDDNTWTLNENCEQIQSELKLIEWGSLLLDAHYQKFLLSKDTKIINLLKLFHSLVDAHINCINEYKLTATILDLIKNGKSFNKSKKIVSKWYSIEQMTLY